MTALAVDHDQDVVTKSEFARRRNVTPGRVSQWISEGKIDGPALVGLGREQRIRESVAVEQLRRRTDVGQRLGNGLSTRLDLPPPVAPLMASIEQIQVSAARDDVDDRIKKARLEQLERANRREAEEDALAAGTYVLAADVAAEMTKMMRDVLGAVEGALPDLAAALAGRFQVPQRDVVHLLRQEFRSVRQRIADAARARGREVPDQLEHDPLTPQPESGRAS